MNLRYLRIFLLCLGVLGLASCSSLSDMPPSESPEETIENPQDDLPPPPPPPTGSRSVSYAPSGENFPNPERGFHDTVNLTGQHNFEAIYQRGFSTARANVRLDAYRNRAIDAAYLKKLDAGFADARKAGVKVIVRFSYTATEGQADAPIGRVLGHIEQLKPVLRKNSDVIASMQAGFIGAWGEWHSSTNGLETPENRKKILDALLSTLPRDRSVTLRYGRDILEYSPQPVNDAQAFSGNKASRIGLHNDCFLSNEHDSNTYLPKAQTPRIKTYLEQSSPFVPVDGEVCLITPEKQRTDCKTAQAELRRYGWNGMNIYYGNTKTGRWEAENQRWKNEGCFLTIAKNLGYRYQLQNAILPETASAGESMSVQFRMRNSGYSRPYNPRVAQLVLRHKGTGKVHRLALKHAGDTRMWLPGPNETKDMVGQVNLPQNLAKGSYDMFLNFPDPEAGIATNPRFSIRLANKNIWEASTGFNRLNAVLEVN